MVVNTNDVPDPAVPATPLGIAEAISSKQAKLEEKYSEIEKRPLLQDINSREGQIHVKDFLWRITEEVGEFIEADVVDSQKDKTWEELADGLHFVAGLCLTTKHGDTFSEAFSEFSFNEGKKKVNPVSTSGNVCLLVMELGCLGNCLKLKPWKQTDVPTDAAYFTYKLRQVVVAYLRLCHHIGLNLEELYKLYWKKSEVNLFRIRSKY